jgi:hypothetical protein
MKSMLTNVNANQNVSKTLNNVKLTVSTFNETAATNFVWTYVDAYGVEAPAKNVALTYLNGVFKSFTDNWQFYTIVGEPTVSKEQALDLALNATADFSYISKDSLGVQVNVSNVKVALWVNQCFVILTSETLPLLVMVTPLLFFLHGIYP